MHFFFFFPLPQYITMLLFFRIIKNMVTIRAVVLKHQGRNEEQYSSPKACCKYLFDTCFNWELCFYMLVKSKDLELEPLSC